MRGRRYDPSYDDAPQPVVAFGDEYPGGHVIAPHRHGRAQLLYGADGVVKVSTTSGVWVVPPQQSVWIPAGVVHEVEMIAAVSMRSAYFSTTVVADLPDSCQVLGMTALMRCLLMESIDVPMEHTAGSREGLIMALLLQELRVLPVLPLSLSMPRDPRLARLCKRFIEAPDLRQTIDDWAEHSGVSRRNFTRLFRTQTGLSFVAWRQQACLFTALPRLAAGESVTAIAVDLGYESPAAFTSMFKRALGVPPSQYFG
jgi:AraC-like DNA-binding protein